MPRFVTILSPNILGLVVLSTAVGLAINRAKEEGRPLKMLFRSLNSVMLGFVEIILWYTPFGIISLTASKVVSSDDIMTSVKVLGTYVSIILGSQAIHFFLALPVIYAVFTRKNPWRFCLNVTSALITSWVTDSSSTALPDTMKSLIKKSKLNPNVVKFITPLSAFFNMDGALLYETLTCVYIANIRNFDVTISDVFYISLLAAASTAGASAIPHVGIVSTTVVLTAMGLPTDDITLMMSVDWFLDRFSTVINVWGNCIGAAILDHYFRDSFSEKSPSVTARPSIENPVMLSLASFNDGKKSVGNISTNPSEGSKSSSDE